MLRCFKSLIWALSGSMLVVGCGGGGGSSDESPNPVPDKSGVSQWKILAQVSHDNCGERLAPVHQTITLSNSGSSLKVDTSIVKVGAVSTSDGFTFGFEEANGDCVRKYDTQFSSLTDATADVHIAVSTACGGFSCQDEWVGTASKVN